MARTPVHTNCDHGRHQCNISQHTTRKKKGKNGQKSRHRNAVAAARPFPVRFARERDAPVLNDAGIAQCGAAGDWGPTAMPPDLMVIDTAPARSTPGFMRGSRASGNNIPDDPRARPSFARRTRGRARSNNGAHEARTARRCAATEHSSVTQARRHDVRLSPRRFPKTFACALSADMSLLRRPTRSAPSASPPNAACCDPASGGTAGLNAMAQKPSWRSRPSVTQGGADDGATGATAVQRIPTTASAWSSTQTVTSRANDIARDMRRRACASRHATLRGAIPSIGA